MKMLRIAIYTMWNYAAQNSYLTNKYVLNMEINWFLSIAN